MTAARAQADFVIVAPHAGTEYDNRPNETQLELASAAMAAGADAYIGAHAHVVQPVEQRGSQLIAWGLGNFIFNLDDVDLANIPEPRVSADPQHHADEGRRRDGVARRRRHPGRRRGPPAPRHSG